MTSSSIHTDHRLGHHTPSTRQDNTMPAATSVTVRLRVTVPHTTKLPDRVRLVVKERGVFFFPYRRKLISVYLNPACWTRLPDAVWQNNTVQEVAMDVPKLLKKAQRKRLVLKLYCLRRRTVQHKAIGSLERLLQQSSYEELVLDLHYPGCPLQAQATEEHAASSDEGRCTDSQEGVTMDEKQDLLNAGVRQAEELGQQRASLGNELIGHDAAALKEEEGLNPNGEGLPEGDRLTSDAAMVGLDERLDLHDAGVGLDEGLDLHDAGVGLDEGLDLHDAGIGLDEGLDLHDAGVDLGECLEAGVCLEEGLDLHDAGSCKNEQASLPSTRAKRKQRRRKRQASKTGSAAAERDAAEAKERQTARKARNEALKKESHPQSRHGTALKGLTKAAARLLQRLPVRGAAMHFSRSDIEVLCIGASFLVTMGGLLYVAVTAVAAKAPEMQAQDWVANVGLAVVIFCLYFMFGRRGQQDESQQHVFHG